MAVRKHLITGEPVLFAPARATRPGAFTGAVAGSERCPFCPGHEGDTPPEIARAGDPWKVRVFPNRYPPADGSEVIVESPDHTAAFDTIAHGEALLEVYRQRYAAHADAAYAALFKNEGSLAAASIAHVHSQLVPLPFLPPRIAREQEAFAAAAACPLCRSIDAHRRDALLLDETPSFAVICPSTAGFAFEQWIVPKRHVAELMDFDAEELRELAILLQRSSRTAARFTGSYNWMMMNFPHALAAHFYVDVVPRVTILGGFELGTGASIEILDPAAAAERLRNP